MDEATRMQILDRELAERGAVAKRIREQLGNLEYVERLLSGIAAIAQDLLSFDPNEHPPHAAVYLIGKHAESLSEVEGTVVALQQYDDLINELRELRKQREGLPPETDFAGGA